MNAKSKSLRKQRLRLQQRPPYDANMIKKYPKIPKKKDLSFDYDVLNEIIYSLKQAENVILPDKSRDSDGKLSCLLPSSKPNEN